MSQEKPTKSELIAEARRLAGSGGGKPLSRNYFRSHSPFKDRWSAHFPTFPDFMKEAGMAPAHMGAPKAEDFPIEKQVEIECEKVLRQERGLAAQVRLPEQGV